MKNQNVFEKPTFLEKIDIFGVAIAIRFNTLSSHNTRFGGLVTMIIMGIILYEIVSVIRVLFAQATPSVIQSDEYVYQPEQFQMKPDQFNFAFGLQDMNHLQYMDNTIYKVKATHQSMKKVYNDVTKQFDPVWVYKELQLVQCTEKNFQIDQSKDYFLSAAYKKLFCFKPEELEATIEGEFSALAYQAISIDVYECIGNGCASDEIKKKYLQLPTLGIYMSDNIIQIQNKDDPKKAIGKNLFSKSGPQLAKFLQISLVNNYVNSDFGFYGSEISKQRVVSLSSFKEQVLPRTNEVLYTLYIAYEKNREINYYRKYLKLDEAFSQLGGMFNGLLAIGFLICKPISRLELNRKLLNSIFNINLGDQDQSITENQQNQQQQQNDKQEDKNELKTNNIIQKNNNKNKSNTRQKSYTTNQLNSPTISQDKLKSPNQSFVKEKNYFKDGIQSIIKTQFSGHLIQFKDSILNFFLFCKRFQTQQQKLINQGTTKLYNSIDIFYILNKLIEIEKLKHLLLNENQIKLFEYLPRPELNINDVIIQEQKEKELKLKKQQAIHNKYLFQNNYINNVENNHNNNNNNGDSNNSTQNKLENIPSTLTQKSKSIQTQCEFSIFGYSNKTAFEKAQDAQKAFNEISKNNVTKSKIDYKLIQMLDPRLVNTFIENSIDLDHSLFEIDQQQVLSQEDKVKTRINKTYFKKKSLFQNNNNILNEHGDDDIKRRINLTENYNNYNNPNKLKNNLNDEDQFQNNFIVQNQIHSRLHSYPIKYDNVNDENNNQDQNLNEQQLEEQFNIQQQVASEFDNIQTQLSPALSPYYSSKPIFGNNQEFIVLTNHFNKQLQSEEQSPRILSMEYQIEQDTEQHDLAFYVKK